jgi:glycosyltransferase involved in cell wall biosynthesis
MSLLEPELNTSMQMAALPKAVVTHAGRRDSYQLALALDEGNLLEALITDFYWNPAVYSLLKTAMPHRGIPERICAGLDSRRVHLSSKAVFADIGMKLTGGKNLYPYKDAALGSDARKRAIKTGSALFSYSYYAHSAFRCADTELEHRFLFQLHPHPQSVREILAEEIERTPIARASLMMEGELNLPQEAFEQLAQEAQLANGWAAASRYTAQTLADHGVPAEKIHVVPYGVSLKDFPPRTQPPAKDAPFTIIYVGSLIQRKGLSYLLDAVRALKSKNVRLILRGRGAVDRDLLKHYSDIDFDLKLGVSLQELVQDLQRSDVFILPSLTEGFAQVILEAMACGVPVITTANTCAPDVMTDGVEGFILPIRDSKAIEEKIIWGIENRQALAAMGRCAAEQASLFTLERFRSGIRIAYRAMIESLQN